jgi:hypothetical protein
MARSLRVVSVCCLAVGLLAAPAGAQGSKVGAGRAAASERAPQIRAEDGPSYEVKFEDDLLDGAGFDGTLAIIRIRPNAVKTTLIRPRTHFVPELLKSVEKI